MKYASNSLHPFTKLQLIDNPTKGTINKSSLNVVVAFVLSRVLKLWSLYTAESRSKSRKESLDSVDFELIKLGLHKSTEDIRAQYLQVDKSQSKDNHDDT